ncbi:hypothetical protein F4810DRAFT_668553, partial [Camillea tinctor]
MYYRANTMPPANTHHIDTAPYFDNKTAARVFSEELCTYYDHIALDSNGPRLSYVSWGTVSLLIYRINGSRRLSFPRPKSCNNNTTRGTRSVLDAASHRFGRWTIHSLGIAVKFTENVPGNYIYNCKVREICFLPASVIRQKPVTQD